MSDSTLSNKLRDRGWDLKINKGLVDGWIDDDKGVRLSFSLDLLETTGPPDPRDVAMFLSPTKPSFEQFRSSIGYERVSPEWYEKECEFIVSLGRRTHCRRRFCAQNGERTFVFEVSQLGCVSVGPEKREFFATLFGMVEHIAQRRYEKDDGSCTGSDSGYDSD